MDRGGDKMRFCFALLNSEGGILVINMDYLSTAVVVQRKNKKEEEAPPSPVERLVHLGDVSGTDFCK